ncbi:hypothetical protein AVEN_256100-1 [Araneus ventricosus]|uniref:DUF5641 domain-containing protein n=1 Tax=Araneus ventricosus TaxID=182803 RepID=A0A4Y2D8V4_ARAVE|nr:hypothetical protein AVEN_256100-1 [Araneus ventricosus]
MITQNILHLIMTLSGGFNSHSTPVLSLLDLAENRLNSWLKLKQIFQHFWNRLYQEYLNRLQSIPKRDRVKSNISKGEMFNLLVSLPTNTLKPNYPQQEPSLSVVYWMLSALKEQDYMRSLKVHLLHSHVQYGPKNFGAFSEDPGLRLHQTSEDMYRRRLRR